MINDRSPCIFSREKMIKDSTLLRGGNWNLESRGSLIAINLLRFLTSLFYRLVFRNIRNNEPPKISQISRAISTHRRTNISLAILPHFNSVRSIVHVGSIQSVNFPGNRSTGTHRPEEDCQILRHDWSTRFQLQHRSLQIGLPLRLSGGDHLGVEQTWCSVPPVSAQNFQREWISEFRTLRLNSPQEKRTSSTWDVP